MFLNLPQDVVVKEIGIQQCLHETSYPSCKSEFARRWVRNIFAHVFVCESERDILIQRMKLGSVK